MRLAEAPGEGPVVLAQLGQHVRGLDVGRVIVSYPLQPGDVADRRDGSSSNLSHALGDRIGHGEELVGMLVQQQVVVAEMRTAQMPVKALGLEVQGEHVGQGGVHGRRDVAGRLVAQVAG